MNQWTAGAAGANPVQTLGPVFRQLALPRADGCTGHESGAQWFRQRIGDLRRNPDFAATAGAYARSIVQLFEGHYLVNKAMANVARQTVCMAIMSSYFGQPEKSGGAFLSSIQGLTTAMGVCSKNTTAANVALLERLGLVVRLENRQDRRWLYIRPTENLVAAARDFSRISLIAADALFPSRHYSASFDGDQALQERCFAVGLYSFIAVQHSVFGSAESHLFTTADGGMAVLFKLLSLYDDASQSRGHAVEFPFDEMGSLFGSSRTHIRRLMKSAEAGGYVRLLEKGGRKIEILPPLEDLFENVVAASVARAQLDVHLARGEDLRSAG